MIFSDDCQNGSPFSKWPPGKYKTMYVSNFGEFLCAIHALIGFQGQRIHFLYFQTQNDVDFQNDGNIYILINIVRWCYVYDDF